MNKKVKAISIRFPDGERSRFKVSLREEELLSMINNGRILIREDNTNTFIFINNLSMIQIIEEEENE